MDPLVAAGAPLQQCERVVVARRRRGRAEHDRDERDAAARARADQHVAGHRRMAGLQPVDGRVLREQRVAVADRARPVARDERRRRAVGDLADEPVAAQEHREPRQIVRRGVVAGRVEPDRVREVGVLELQLPRALVHQANEGHARAGDVLGQRDGGVVGGLEHQPAQQVGDRQPLARAQAQLGLDRGGDVVGRRDLVGQPRLLHGEQRGHQLGRGGDRAALLRRTLIDDLAGARLDQDRRRGAQRGRSLGGPRGARGGAGEQRHEREDRQVCPEPHQRNLIFVPGVSVCGSRSGLSSRIWSSGTSTFTAMPDGVSPDLIV